MAKDLPATPDTAEIAAPEAGREGIGAWIDAWLDEMGAFAADPRQWRSDPASISAATAALTDPHARAVLDQRLDAGTAAPLEVEPGGTGRRDRIAAEDLAGQLEAIEIDRVSRELLHAVWYGYAIAECLWEIDGGRARLADLKVRDPARFRFRPDGTPLLIARDRPRGIELPPAKFTVLRQPRQHGGQPHGPGVARWCLWPVWLKRQGVRFWSTALEKFGMPALVISLRGDAPPEEVALALETVSAVIGGAGVVTKEGQKIETLDSQRRAGGDYKEFTAAMDGMIADAVLGQRATSEIGPWQATAEVHAEVLQRLVAADARRLSAALQHSLATWLTHWNHPGAAVPRLIRDTAPPEDLERRANRDDIVARMSELKPTQAYVERTYGGEWEAAAPSTPPARAEEERLALAGPRRAGDAIDRAVDALIEDEGWTRIMEPIVQPVLDAATDAPGFATFRQRLDGEALQNAMDTSELATTLHRTTFSAEIAGQGEPEGGE